MDQKRLLQMVCTVIILVVAAKTSPELGNKGISMFVIDRDTPGISATKVR